MIKAVADTNVLLAAFLSPNPASPNKEVLAAWQKGDWMWQHSGDTLAEYVEKLQHFGVDENLIRLFVKDLLLLGEEVEVSFFHLPNYPEDPDDIAFLLCALNGDSTFLISYDEHLLSLAPHYPQLGIVQPRQFLTAIRDF